MTQNFRNLAEKPKNPHDGKSDGKTVAVWFKNFLHKKNDNEDSIREVLEDYIEDMSTYSDATSASTNHELELLGNVLELRNLTAENVMIPRVDIVAINIDTSPNELLTVLASTQHHRIPVYRDTIDDVIGLIHIKDVLKSIANNTPLILKDLVREAPIISPALPVFDLLLMMRDKGHHMAFVVDEYGGIDGLVTIGDVIGSIVGEIRDTIKTA